MSQTDDSLISHKGTFFFPEHPDNKVSGTLTIGPDGAGRLELLGAFDNEFLARRKMQTIWGLLFNGDTVTLIDSYRGKSVYRSAGSEVNYSIGTTLIGTHVLDRQEAVFTTISAEIDHLQEWLGIDGGSLEFSLDFKTTTYHYDQPADIDFKIDDQLTGSIFFRNEFWDNRRFGNEFGQRVRLELESTDKRSLNQSIKALLGFQQLLSIFLGQQVDLKHIAVTSPDEKRQFINPTPGREMPVKTINVHYKPKQSFTPLPEHSVPFVAYKDIAEDFQKIIGNWYHLLETELRPVISILLDALTDHTVFEEANFMRAWQGVEAFHRLIIQDTPALKKLFKAKMERVEQAFAMDTELKEWVKQATTFAYEPYAKDRLRDVIRQYQHLLPGSITEDIIITWAKEMGNTRNYLTHFDPVLSKKKISGKKLYQYTTLLNWLLVILILTRLGIDEDLLKNLSSHQHLYLSELLRDHNANN